MGTRDTTHQKSHYEKCTSDDQHGRTPITLLLIIISEKGTLNRLSGQFGALTRGKKNIANRAKQSEC
jgi:hypothetical protein